MKIGVYGSATGVKEEIIPKAKEIGKQIALTGNIIVTGGCTGLPYEAVKGARENNGKSIGFSPGKDLKEHTEKYGFPEDSADELIFTGKGIKIRNVMSVKDSDASVFVSGRIGTLNEFTIAYDEGKIMGVLTETGGVADMIKDIIDKLQKPTTGVVIYESDPTKLIKKIIEVTKNGK